MTHESVRSHRGWMRGYRNRAACKIVNILARSALPCLSWCIENDGKLGRVLPFKGISAPIIKEVSCGRMDINFSDNTGTASVMLAELCNMNNSSQSEEP